MSDTNKFDNLPIEVYFYVDPSTKNIDGVFAYHPFGISIRSGQDWMFVRRADTKLDEFLQTHEAYVLDWDTDYTALGDTDDNEPLEEHVAVQMYDKGELNSQNLLEYAKLVYDPEEA
jgi:hypothetical protein